MVSLHISAQTSIPVSYYNAGDVQAILSQPGCTGIRVYPVYDEVTKSNSTMIIGIDEYGQELNSDTSAVTKYRMYSGVNENRPMSKTLNRYEAQLVCSAFNSKNSAFITDLSAEALGSHLGGDSQGLSLSYLSNKGNNFEASGYQEESGIHSFGVPSPGDPCPSSCGSRSQYLCPPN